MATKRKQVTTYVDDATYKWVAAGAKRETRSVSQFLNALIVNMARAKESPPAAQQWRAPVDTSGLFTHRPSAPTPPAAAASVIESPPDESEPEPEWSDPDPDYDPDFDYHTQIIQGVSHEKSVDEVKVYCRQLRRPDWEPSAEVVRAAAAEWAAKQPAVTTAPEPAAESDPAPVRFTPRDYAIPDDWVNEYGLTLAQQNVVGREDDLEYVPPAARPGVAH